MLHSFFENHFLLCGIGFASCSLLTQVASGRRCLTRAVENHFPPGAKKKTRRSTESTAEMLFVHQAPRMWQDPKGATATLRGPSDRPRSKRSGSAGSGRRPSSAVGGGAGDGHRRHGGDRPSRPGSASGSARFGTALRTSSPPGSARSQTPVLVATNSDGGGPGGMHFRVSSAGRTSPNRPRTPSSQRRSAQAQVVQGKDATSSVTRLDGQSDGGSTPSAAQKGNGHSIATTGQNMPCRFAINCEGLSSITFE